MAYDQQLANRVREILAEAPKLHIEEKEMFRGLAFMVNGKMCVNVSGDKLMCRFDPDLQEEVLEKEGFELMMMKKRVYKGYGYVSPEVIKTKKQLMYWIQLCLDFNPKAKASKKK